MPRGSKSPTDEAVACHSCQREVPRSIATMAEGRDYVFFFCGPECYAGWHAPDSQGGFATGE